MPHGNCVVTFASSPSRGHDYHSRAALAEKLAELLGYAYAGDFDAEARYGGHVYFVPAETLALEHARKLGIAGERDLFGGVVPWRFVGTKAISHGVMDASSRAPAGWSHTLAQNLRDVVLPGFTVFDVDDARIAGRVLLRQGGVRLKPAHRLGGTGQSVAEDDAALDAAVAALDTGDLHEHGAVIEQNIDEARTCSIGEVRIGELHVAYYGTQRVTRNHLDLDVYGGSDLTVVRGRMVDLLQSAPPTLMPAIEQSIAYDAAVRAAFPDFFASRRNYDVLQGRDRAGRAVSGVLEQSWRIGGATPAELAALLAFKAEPSLERVRASSHEIYSASPVLPAHADVHFDGFDEQVGRLRKYSIVELDE